MINIIRRQEPVRLADRLDVNSSEDTPRLRTLRGKLDFLSSKYGSTDENGEEDRNMPAPGAPGARQLERSQLQEHHVRHNVAHHQRRLAAHRMIETTGVPLGPASTCHLLSNRICDGVPLPEEIRVQGGHTQHCSSMLCSDHDQQIPNGARGGHHLFGQTTIKGLSFFLA